ncbi:MAG: OmpH family outer membrane protein [Kiritimatiellae bacterium]|nr:OmpH family outer membrane protein [Kiritimatiellia bacterium]
MKSMLVSRLGLVAALAAVWLGAAPMAQAQTEKDRIAFVNMNKVFDEFYKTKLAQAQIKDQEDEFKKDLEAMMNDYKALQDRFKQAREESEDRTLSTEARDKRRADAEEKLIELREMEGKIRRQEESRRRQFAESMKRVRDKLVAEIQDTLSGYAKNQGYLAVLDTSGDNLNNVPVILYFDPSRDVTQTLVEMLNSGKK